MAHGSLVVNSHLHLLSRIDDLHVLMTTRFVAALTLMVVLVDETVPEQPWQQV
jgi:hypothetical protein